MITKDAIETAYCFLHQKQRVYQYSTMEWQRDDIEYAIAEFVEQMDPELYAFLADDSKDFLLNHTSFSSDINLAVTKLEQCILQITPH